MPEKTYKFKTIHVPGKLHKAPDAGSRYPVDPPELFLDDEQVELAAGITEEYINEEVFIEEDELSLIKALETELHATVTENLSEISTVSWRMVQEATNADEVLSKVRDIVQEGLEFNIRLLPDEVKQYARFLDNMYIQDDVILYSSRTVILERLRKWVIETLHSAHQGCSQMWSRAEVSVFWPGITGDIASRRVSCRTCQEIAPSSDGTAEALTQDLFGLKRKRKQSNQTASASRYYNGYTLL